MIEKAKMIPGRMVVLLTAIGKFGIGESLGEKGNEFSFGLVELKILLRHPVGGQEKG